MNPTPMTQAFQGRYGPNLTVGVVDMAVAREFLQLSPIVNHYVPWVAFVDREGMVRAQYTGTDELFKNPVPLSKAEIDKLIAAPAPKKSAPAKKASAK